MATRCTVKIHGPDAVTTLYRHWDGYPAGAGRDLAATTRGMIGGTALDLAGKLLAETRDPGPRDGRPRPVYELTTSEETHGDTEWRYRIWLFPGEGPGFQVLNRVPGGEWTPVVGGGAITFRRFVAEDVRAIRARMRAALA